MNVDWWELPESPGEWQGLDPRFHHIHFWIGNVDDIFVLEVCSPLIEDAGITFATKYSLAEAQYVAEEVSELIVLHMQSAPVEPGFLI